MNTNLVPLLVPNTDVVVTERRHITKIGGTKEQPLIWIKGIARAFVLANSQNVRKKETIDAVATPVPDHPDVLGAPSGDSLPDGAAVRLSDGH